MLSKKYNIYILRCGDNSLYTGIALDFKKRFEEHKNRKGAKYTKIKAKHPLSLAMVFSAENRSEAGKVEAYIKKQTKETKEFFIKKPCDLEKKVYEKLNIKIKQINFDE